jgi:hypothetical protein
LLANPEWAYMTCRNEHRRRRHLALLLAAFALTLSGCASAGFKPTPGGSNAYHYREPFQAGA